MPLTIINCTPLIDLTLQAFEHHHTNKLTRQSAIQLIDAWAEFARVIDKNVRRTPTFDPWRTGEATRIYTTITWVITNALIHSLKIPETDDEYYARLETMEKVHTYLNQLPITNHAQIRRIRREYAAGNYTTFCHTGNQQPKVSRVETHLL